VDNIKSEKIFITKSFEETQKLGEEFVKRIIQELGVSLSKKRAYVVGLYGDLGSGKTTFVQGLAKGLGIKRRIISPTFIIIRTYKLKAKSAKRKTTVQNLKFFYHIDLYRIKSDRDIDGLGLGEIISDPQNIVAIEWAEKTGNLLPEDRIDIRFASISESKRRITINIKNQKLNIKNTRLAKALAKRAD